MGKCSAWDMPGPSGRLGKCSYINNDVLLVIFDYYYRAWGLMTDVDMLEGPIVDGVTRGSRLAPRESQRAFWVKPERRYDLYVSLITTCNSTCALSGQYYNKQFETAALTGPLVSRNRRGPLLVIW